MGVSVVMAKKFRRMRTFARTAAKSMEKRLVENAKKLREDHILFCQIMRITTQGDILIR